MMKASCSCSRVLGSHKLEEAVLSIGEGRGGGWEEEEKEKKKLEGEWGVGQEEQQ